jgi:putative membrane protein
LLACAGAALHAQGSAAGSSTPAASAAQSTPAAVTTLRANERTFMTKAAGSGRYEVEASQLAEQKATDQLIKELASMLVKHHSDANNELMQLASNKGLSLPEKLPRDKQAELDRLSKLSGSAFDREYMRRVGLAAHQSDIKLFQNASRTARDPELKAWVNNTLPTLREHLAQAQKIPLPAASTGAASNRSKP